MIERNEPVVSVKLLQGELHETVAAIAVEGVARNFHPILRHEEIPQRIHGTDVNDVQIEVISTKFVNCQKFKYTVYLTHLCIEESQSCSI